MLHVGVGTTNPAEAEFNKAPLQNSGEREMEPPLWAFFLLSFRDLLSNVIIPNFPIIPISRDCVH